MTSKKAKEETIELGKLFRYLIITLVLLAGGYVLGLEAGKKRDAEKIEETVNGLFEDIMEIHTLRVGSIEINENMTIADVRYNFNKFYSHPARRALVYNYYKWLCSMG